MPDESFNAANQYVLIGIILTCLVVLPTLFIKVIVCAIVRQVRHRPVRGTVLRLVAGLATCTAIAVYLLYAVGFLRNEKGAVELCQAAVPPAHAHKRAVYVVSFIPLGGECRVDGVGTFDTGKVPGATTPLMDYANPTVAVATVLALASFLAIRRFPDGVSVGREDSCDHD